MSAAHAAASAPRRSVVLVGLAFVVVVAGCRPDNHLEGFDVTLIPVVDCTQTNLTVDCADEGVLAETTITARWIVERADSGIGIALTTHDGVTLPGWRFANDLSVTEVPGCSGEGGDCTFVRHRTASIDANDDGCTRQTNRVFAGHTSADDTDVIEGFFSDIAAADENCGTASTTELTWAVTARRVDDPVLARQEAQR
jgi:hypothetical protein